MSQFYNFDEYTVKQLRDHLRSLKEQGYEVTLGGNKTDLVSRLHVLYGQAAPAPAPTAAPAPATPQVTVAKKTTKKVTRSPAELLISSIRNADQALNVAVAALLETYNATDRYAVLMGSLVDIAETKPGPIPVPTTIEGLRALKMVELKKILKDRGEKVGGKKEELVERILNPTPQVPHGIQFHPLPVEATAVTNLPPVTNLHSAPRASFSPINLPPIPGAPASMTQVSNSTATSPPMTGGVPLPLAPVQYPQYSVPPPIQSVSPVQRDFVLPTLEEAATIPVRSSSVPLSGAIALPTLGQTVSSSIPLPVIPGVSSPRSVPTSPRSVPTSPRPVITSPRSDATFPLIQTP